MRLTDSEWKECSVALTKAIDMGWIETKQDPETGKALYRLAPEGWRVAVHLRSMEVRSSSGAAGGSFPDRPSPAVPRRPARS
jgi:hypothetical protein